MTPAKPLHDLADPEYLNKLADLADPDKLWQRHPWQQPELTPEQKHQLYTGVALRRHASDVAELHRLRGTGMSLLITPLPRSGRRVQRVRTPQKNKDIE